MVALAEAFIRVRPSVDVQEFRRETEKAMRDAGGNLKIGLDASQVRRDLKVLASEIGKLRGKDLTVNVDVTKAYVDVVTLREEVDKLGRQRPTVRPDVDATTAFAKVAALAAGMDETRTRAETLAATIGATAKSTADFGDAADEAKTKATGLGEETRKTKDHTTGLGDETDKTRTKVMDLAAEFHKTRDALAAMGSEFRKSGQIDVDQFKSLSSRLRELQQVGQVAGAEAGKGFAAGMQGTLSTPILGPALIAGLVGAAVIAAPAVGAAMASAITVGIGGGTLAAGIVAAAKDQRVVDAWSEVGRSAKDGLVGAADVFVDPLIRSAGKFDSVYNAEILPSLRSNFASLAPLVDRLSDGVAGFATNALPGFDELVDTAGPFIEMLVDELPNFGNAISDFFESVSAGGPGALQFFGDLLVFTQKSIVALGNMIEFLSKGYAAMSGISRIMHGDLTGAVTLFDQFGDKGPKNLHLFRDAGMAMFRVVHPGLQELQSRLSQTALTTDMLAGQMVNKLFTSMFTLDQATLGFAVSQTRLSDVLKENGLQLDIHSAKGQANRSSILASVQANMQQYQANVAAGMSAADAATAYDANTRALESQLRAAGFTQEAIDGLIGKYRGVPDKVNTEIAMKGLTEAIQSLDDAIRLANNLDGRKINTYLVNHVATYYEDGTPQMGHSRYGPNERRYGGIDAYAHGGIAAARGTVAAAANGMIATTPTVLFGERGTGGPGRSLEGFLPAAGISRDRAQDLLSTMSGWWGFALVDQRRLAMRDGGLVTLARALSMDTGLGVLAPGSNLVLNGTGASESIMAVDGSDGGRPAPTINITINQLPGESADELLARLKRELSWGL